MSCLQDLDLCVPAGATFSAVLRWSTDVLVSKAITGISKAAPAVVTAVAHGLVSGWRAAVVSAGGMQQINAGRYPPHDRDYHPVTNLTTDTVSLDDVSSAGYTAYTSGGFLVYQTPVSLAGCTALMRIRDYPITGTVLKTMSELDGVAIDDTAKTITLTFDTAALTWTTGYFDLEMTDATGKITQIAQGVITIN